MLSRLAARSPPDDFRKTLDSYERSFEDDDVAVVHHHDNGLDGKVSCMRIDSP